jgi:hypothetical protein
MADEVKEGVVKEGTAGDQKKMGTFKMHLQELQVHFRDLMEEGITEPRVFEKTMEDFLRQFETIRVVQEREIRRLETQMAYCRARQRAASEHANLILAILTTNVNQAIQAYRDTGGASAKPPESTLPDEIISDTEMLKRICICGCVDEEDAARCDCSCHTVGYCDDPRCAVCPDKKSAAEAKPKKKKVTKKKAAKRKKATK